MPITIKYNVLVTLAFFGYMIVLSPLFPDTEIPLLVESIYEESVAAGIIVTLLSLILGIAISMYLIRSLWNRLFPKLCGWSVISLAESYALSIFLAIFVVGGGQ